MLTILNNPECEFLSVWLCAHNMGFVVPQIQIFNLHLIDISVMINIIELLSEPFWYVIDIKNSQIHHLIVRIYCYSYDSI